MTDVEFSGLLSRGEGETLDFKVQCYDLKHGRGDLIKDILSMANTPRNGSAYIVLGVDWNPETGSRVVGLSAQVMMLTYRMRLVVIVFSRLLGSHTHLASGTEFKSE
ncbi:hypothetical protein Y695_02972 [Hydrogenophaga sp. T4]|nr:hypothetical protein Y695_02972 [Hydrogenophaga sp. T4]